MLDNDFYDTCIEHGLVVFDKKRADSLLRSEEILLALEAAGVDNWDYYGDALSHLYKNDK